MKISITCCVELRVPSSVAIGILPFDTTSNLAVSASGWGNNDGSLVSSTGESTQMNPFLVVREEEGDGRVK